jgi:hypothetical protein
MGHGNFVLCESCGYEREFMLGSGMMYFDLNQIILSLDKKSYEEVSKILEKYPKSYAQYFDISEEHWNFSNIVKMLYKAQNLCIADQI